MDDVPRETAETEGELSAKVKKRANDGQQAAEEEQRAAEFAERVHLRILPVTAQRIFPPSSVS